MFLRINISESTKDMTTSDFVDNDIIYLNIWNL